MEKKQRNSMTKYVHKGFSLSRNKIKKQVAHRPQTAIESMELVLPNHTLFLHTKLQLIHT